MHTNTYRNIWQKGIVQPTGKINELLAESHIVVDQDQQVDVMN